MRTTNSRALEATANPAVLHGVTRRSFTAGAAALTVGAALSPTAFAQDASSENSPADEVVIFHTNDMHGYLSGDDGSVFGIDYVAGLKNTEPNCLLLDAGDASQGAPLASLTNGAAPFELMNAAGYDAMCLGNHEFDYGLDVLTSNVGSAQFPVLGANVLNSEGKPFTAGMGASGDGCATVLECGGRRIGIFGLLSTSTTWTVVPAFIDGISFADEIQIAEEQIAALDAQGVDAIVCLAHLGNGDAPCTSTLLAQNLSDEAASKLCAIVDGHSHTVENNVVNGVLVVQTGHNLEHVGKLTLTFSDEGVSAFEELYDAASAADLSEPDEGVEDILDQIEEKQNEILNVNVCPNPSTLWAGWMSDGGLAAPTRIVETNFGDVVCDGFRQLAQEYLSSTGDEAPVVAVENGGAIRERLPRGMVQRRDMVTAFPFANTIMVKKVSPKMLKLLFESGLNECTGQDTQTGMLLQTTVTGGFMQLAGATLTIDPNAVVGQRVSSIVLDGTDTELDLTDDEPSIVVVSNSYVMTGGGIPEMADVPLLAELGGELEQLGNYLNSLRDGNDTSAALPLMVHDEERIKYRSEYVPSDWSASVLVLDADGQPAANTGVSLQIDSGDVVDVQTNDQGLATVTLEDGPHAIAIAPTGEPDPAQTIVEAYANNYIGIGVVCDEYRAWPTVTLK